MACFLVPTAEAIVTTVAGKVLEKKYQKVEKPHTCDNHITPLDGKLPFYKKLKWLSNLLWGGSVLLAFEHVWHGEVVPYFPFLTAMNNPEDAQVMFHEMSTVGVTMALIVTVAWCGMLAVSKVIESKPATTEVHPVES